MFDVPVSQIEAKTDSSGCVVGTTISLTPEEDARVKRRMTRFEDVKRIMRKFRLTMDGVDDLSDAEFEKRCRKCHKPRKNTEAVIVGAAGNFAAVA